MKDVFTEQLISASSDYIKNLQEALDLPAAIIKVIFATGDPYYGLSFNITINGESIKGKYFGEDHELKIATDAINKETKAILHLLFCVANNKIPMNGKGLPEAGVYKLTKQEMEAWLKDGYGLLDDIELLEGILGSLLNRKPTPSSTQKGPLNKRVGVNPVHIAKLDMKTKSGRDAVDRYINSEDPDDIDPEKVPLFKPTWMDKR